MEEAPETAAPAAEKKDEPMEEINTPAAAVEAEEESDDEEDVDEDDEDEDGSCKLFSDFMTHRILPA